SRHGRLVSDWTSDVCSSDLSAFVLAAGGTIRWIGEAVAKLTAGDNILRPRARILSDEQLTGAALEHVQTRLDLWTRTHIERLLRSEKRRGGEEGGTQVGAGH